MTTEAKKPAEKPNVDLENKKKALELALTQIEKQFGKGSIMKLTGGVIKGIPVIPTGSLSLDM
ncbi:MAG TPA: DNA recombination/repair protein RecA, partial [Candidatus Omnitrophota bacterium]|nr:DNA recombination/repair protein RecA [Candidatus Omnitrophota bacterium]